ncbi:MAG: hypothetical protein RL417_1308 [Pseudomonadota bacterium]
MKRGHLAEETYIKAASEQGARAVAAYRKNRGPRGELDLSTTLWARYALHRRLYLFEEIRFLRGELTLGEHAFLKKFVQFLNRFERILAWRGASAASGSADSE